MEAVDSRRGVLLVLLDLSAAFDTIDHSTLLCRLRAIGLSQTVLAWMKSYLVGHTNPLKIGDLTSASVIIQHGVPLGSVLGPLLLPTAGILDCHQIPTIYLQRTLGCTQSVRHRITQRKSDECVNDIRQWLDDNRLFLNETKADAISPLAFSAALHLCMRVIHIDCLTHGRST
jgi:hypothetical protein